MEPSLKCSWFKGCKKLEKMRKTKVESLQDLWTNETLIYIYLSCLSACCIQ